MKKLAFIFVIVVVILSVREGTSQIQFSQFYASPMYLAPSYTGSIRSARMVANYRNQWPAINSFVTYAVSYDQHIQDIKSGIGAMVMRDQAGEGNLALTNAAVSYSWYTEITRDWYFRPGIQFKYSQRSLDFHKLVFGDQINSDGTTSPISNETPPLPKKGYLDIAASALVYSDRYWFGVTADHLLRPDESLYNNGAKVDYKFTFFGGAKIPTDGGSRYRRRKNEEDKSITFSYQYRYQGGYDQLDLGAYWTHTPFTLGVWFRGLPIVQAEKGQYGNPDAIILLVGYQIFAMRIGYSYDFTISSLINTTGGSHEISLIYEFVPNKSRKKRHAVISCPKF